MLKPIITATLIAGTLDILSAFVFAGMAGMTPGGVLGFVASGPFGDQALAGGLSWSIAGLLVHYAIMASMVTAYIVFAPKIAWTMRRPIIAGVLYGIVLWLIMYWIVRPLRWPAIPLPHTAWGIGNALFSHCILVGIPIALAAARAFRSKRV